MQVTITEQPAALLTSADGIVRQSLSLDATDKNALVDSLLLAAQAELDGPKGRLGFTVAEQSVEVTVDSFDCPPIRLPGGSTISNVVVTYLDGDAAEQTLDDASYIVAADGTLSLVEAGEWPTVADQSNAIVVAYDLAPEDGDPRIDQMKAAIIMHAKMHLDMDDVETRRSAINALTSTLWVPSV